MNLDKISDEFDKQLIGAFKKIGANLLSAILGPLTTCTEPLFRKNLGERYFHTGSLLFGGGIWVMAVWLGHYSSPAFSEVAYLKGWWRISHLLRDHAFSLWFGVPITILFISLGCNELRLIRKRQETGKIWHSMSRGESIFGSENAKRDIIIKSSVAITLLVFATVLGIVFCAAWILREKFSELERKRAYGKYLDAVDAQLESNFLFGAMLNGTPPSRNYGLYGPLPDLFTGKYRENVAKAGAGASFELSFEKRTSAKQASPNQQEPLIVFATPQKRRELPPEAISNIQPPAEPEKEASATPEIPAQQSINEPTDAITPKKKRAPRGAMAKLGRSAEPEVETLVGDIPKPWAASKITLQKMAASLNNANSKTLVLMLGLCVLLVFGLVAGGTLVYFLTKSNRDQSAPVQVVAQKQTELPKTSAIGATTAPALQNTSSHNDLQPIPAPMTEDKKVFTASEMSNAARAIKMQEEIEPINELVTDQEKQFDEFKNYCDVAMTNISVKIKKASLFRRSSLTKQKQVLDTQVRLILKAQEDTMSDARRLMSLLGATPPQTPQYIMEQLKITFGNMEPGHRLIVKGINELNAKLD